MKNTVWINRLSGLIRTLTRSQKRDFKKYVKFWGQKNRDERKYLMLFDAVHKALASGEEETKIIPQLLAAGKFGRTPKEISVLAQYLYRKILESMRTTPEASSHLNQLHALAQDVIFLHDKSLFEDGLDLSRKAFSISRTLDKSALEVEWNFWLYRLAGLSAGFSTEMILDWQEKQQELLAILEQKVRFSVIAAQMRIILRKKEELPEILEYQIQQLLREYEAGSTERMPFRARVRLYTALSDYFDHKYMLGTGKTASGLVKKAHLEKSMFFQGLVLETYRHHREFAEEEQVNYFNVLDAYLNRCLRSGRTDLAEQLEGELAKEKNEYLEYRSVAYYRIQRYLALNEFRLARDYLEKKRLAEGIEKYQYRMPDHRLIALRFTAGQVYYALDDYDRAGDWFGQVARMKAENRPDTLLACKVLEVICLWEYGAYKHDTDPARPVKNLRRTLKRNRLLDGFLAKILDGVETVFRHKLSLTKAGFPELLKEIRADYGADRTKLLYYLILAWFDAKLNRTPVSRELLKYEQ